MADFADVWRLLLRYIGCYSDFAQIYPLTWHVSETFASRLKTKNDPHQEHQKWRRPCNQTHSISLSTPQSSSNSSTGIRLRGGTIDRRLPKQHNEINKLINPIFHFWIYKVPHACAIVCNSSCRTLDVIFTFLHFTTPFYNTLIFALLHCYILSMLLFHYSRCFVK